MYWESDANAIGAFSTTPTIYSASLGSYNIYTLRNRVSNARNVWNSAGVPCIITTGGNAKIKVYGGSFAEVKEKYSGFKSSWAGATISSYTTNPGYYLYRGIRKYHRTFQSSTVYVLSTNTYPQNVINHEIGLALGFIGHIPSAGNVMYGVTQPVTALTLRDRRHLNQIH